MSKSKFLIFFFAWSQAFKSMQAATQLLPAETPVVSWGGEGLTSISAACYIGWNLIYCLQSCDCLYGLPISESDMHWLRITIYLYWRTLDWWLHWCWIHICLYYCYILVINIHLLILEFTMALISILYRFGAWFFWENLVMGILVKSSAYLSATTFMSNFMVALMDRTES